MLAILTDDYIIKSNRESGEGRYDIMMIPYDKTKNAVIIEIKSLASTETDKDLSTQKPKINKAIDDALLQIENNKYYKELISNKIPMENIIKVAIVFVGKEPYINKLE